MTAVPFLSALSETGKNEDLSPYYLQELPSYYSRSVFVSQSAKIGVSLKTTNNDLAFGGVTVYDSSAQIDQFPLTYSLKETDPCGTFLLKNKFVYSPYADLSQVKNISSYTGLPDTSVLESIGPDLRINGGRNFSLRFELGWRLRRLPYGSYGKGLFEDIEAAIMF
jgi:hypothetical protein